jgi:pimeloyl-ACP methyl ester carboxylesterase
MPYIEDNGTKLWYSISGQGEPLVLTAGYLLLHRQFDWVVDLLAKDFQVINWNYRGAGHSDRFWAAGYSLDRYVDDLELILDALNLQDVNLWGTSTGSTVTMRYTAKYQKRVKSMISYCMIRTAAYRKAFDSFVSIGEDFGFDALAQFLSWIGVAECNQFSDIQNRIALHEAESMKEVVSLESLAKTAETFSHIDLTSELRKITVPTLLLMGDSSMVGLKNPLVAELAQEFQRCCPHCQTATIKDTGGTFCMYEKPEETAEAVKNFITSLA